MPTYYLPSDFDTLQEALDTVVPGDVIVPYRFAADGGTYYVFTNNITVESWTGFGSGREAGTFVLGTGVTQFAAVGSRDATVRDTLGDTGITLGFGDDLLTHLAGNNTVDMGIGDDRVYGSALSASVIDLNWGDDTYFAVDGNDTVDGDTGEDLLDLSLAQGGVTLSLVGAGPQALGGGSLQIRGFEHLRDSPFDDRLTATAGHNDIVSRGGSDTLFALGGHDMIDATVQTGETLIALGGAGNDTFVIAGDGAARQFGGAGDDTLGSGAGDDTQVGGTGRDILTLGAGRDVAYGGGTDGLGDCLRDVFQWAVLETGADRDVIRDFEQGIDLIDMSLLTPTGAGDDPFARFTYIGQGPFTGSSGELRSITFGAWTLVQVDQDGDGTSDGNLILFGTFALTTDDFVL